METRREREASIKRFANQFTRHGFAYALELMAEACYEIADRPHPCAGERVADPDSEASEKLIEAYYVGTNLDMIADALSKET